MFVAQHWPDVVNGSAGLRGRFELVIRAGAARVCLSELIAGEKSMVDTRIWSGLSKAARAARKLHEAYRLQGPPFDPETVAEAEGHRVIYVDFDTHLSAKVHGYVDPSARAIVVNRAASPARKIHTIARELAHLLLHPDYVDDDVRYQLSGHHNSWGSARFDEDLEADAFAAEFLVPLPVMARYKGVISDRALASLFVVTGGMIANRSRLLPRVNMR